MADGDKELVNELKKQSELSKRSAKAQEKMSKAMGGLQDIIDRNNQLLQFNLKASDLLAIDLGNTTTVFEKYLGASRSIEASMQSNETATRTLGDRVTALSDGFLPAAEGVIGAFEGISEGYSSLENSFKYNAKVIDKLSDSLLTYATSVIGSGKAQLDSTATLIPEVAGNSARMALFSAGLEKNSASIGKFMVRSYLLGENINSMAMGVRSLTNTLSLSARSQLSLVEATANFAKTYKSSTESVLNAMGRLVTTLSIVNRSNNRQTTELFARIQAMTDRIAPDALETALSPLFTQGADSLAKAGLLGIREEAGRLTEGTAGVGDVRSIMRAIVSFRDRVIPTGGGYESSVIGEQIVKGMLGLDSTQINMLAIAERSIGEQENIKEEVATVQDGLKSANTFLLYMNDSLEKLKMFALEYLQKLAEELGPQTLEQLAIVATLVGIFATIAAVVALIPAIPGITAAAIGIAIGGLITMSVYYWDQMLFVLGSMWNDIIAFIKDWIPGASWLIGDSLKIDLTGLEEKLKKEEGAKPKPWETDPKPPPGVRDPRETLGDIEKNTGAVADDIKDRENQRLLEASQKYDQQHLQILKDLINASERRGLKDEMNARNAYDESRKLNGLINKLIDEVVLQNNLLRDRRQTFQ